jgi:hypothetical protein
MDSRYGSGLIFYGRRLPGWSCGAATKLTSDAVTEWPAGSPASRLCRDPRIAGSLGRPFREWPEWGGRRMATDHNSKIRTHCPACRSKYSVPKAFVGHHARCAKCQSRFIVKAQNSHPTEDDILRWLNENVEEGEHAYAPRIVTSRPQSAQSADAPRSPSAPSAEMPERLSEPSSTES